MGGMETVKTLKPLRRRLALENKVNNTVAACQIAGGLKVGDHVYSLTKRYAGMVGTVIAPPTDKAWHDPTEVAVKFECGLWEGSPNLITTGVSYSGEAKSITEFVKNEQGERITHLKLRSRVTSAEAKYTGFIPKRVRAKGDVGTVLQIDPKRKDGKFVEVRWDTGKNGKTIKDPFTGWTKAKITLIIEPPTCRRM